MLEAVDAGLPPRPLGLFTQRGGGHSRGCYTGLNLSLRVGDDPHAVVANRALLAARMSVDLDHMWIPEQVHGAGVAVVSGRYDEARAAGADALVTRDPTTAVAVLAADCLPVLLADPGAGVVAAAHAGRAGLVAGVLQATVAAMVDLGAGREAVHASIGPSVCGGCYGLPETLAAQVARAVPGAAGRTRAGTASADLAAGARAVLAACGVRSVVSSTACTVEQPATLFSYRRDGVTGRQAAVVRAVGG